MDDRADYYSELMLDMPEQFKGQPNIAAYQKALASQLAEVREFFCQLLVLRTLRDAEGAQLDGIGGIVVLTRAEAMAIAQAADIYVPMDDETYRLYLAWKTNLNTSDCTHKEVYRALKMFWDKTPLYYSEDPAMPATIIYTVPMAVSEHEAAVFRIASMVKAAGVGVHFDFPGHVYSVADYSGCAVADLIRERVVEAAN